MVLTLLRKTVGIGSQPLLLPISHTLYFRSAVSLTNLPDFEFHSFPSPVALATQPKLHSELPQRIPPPPMLSAWPLETIHYQQGSADLPPPSPLVFKTTVFTHGFYLCTFLGALSCWKTLLRTKFGEKSVWISKVGLNTPRICNRPSRSLIVRGSGVPSVCNLQVKYSAPHWKGFPIRAASQLHMTKQGYNQLAANDKLTLAVTQPSKAGKQTDSSETGKEALS